jgi:hypothetical protein
MSTSSLHVVAHGQALVDAVDGDEVANAQAPVAGRPVEVAVLAELDMRRAWVRDVLVLVRLTVMHDLALEGNVLVQFLEHARRIGRHDAPGLEAEHVVVVALRHEEGAVPLRPVERPGSRSRQVGLTDHVLQGRLLEKVV